MAISRMIIENKRISKRLSNSEANIGNQIRGIKDSSVAAYYLCDIKDFPKVKSYLEEYITRVIVPTAKMKEFYENALSNIAPYRVFFKNKLNLFDENCIYFLNEDISISNLHFEQRGQRVFFYFEEKNERDFKFCKSIIGGITKINFERVEDTLFVYLSLIDDLASEILKEKTDISKEELASILDGYIDSYTPIDTGIRKFGIDFFEVFEKNLINVNELLKCSQHKDKETYALRIKEGINLAKVLNKKTVYIGHDLENNDSLTFSTQMGYNKIFYGIPGCGKSWHIENRVLENVDKVNDVFRTTFYLDYSNSDFIGQIYPKVVNNDVVYEFVPGPFTKALERAYRCPDKMIYLVIEEINRGNAAAIFGDTFQLLDRLKENKGLYQKGDSEYPITNQFIEDYLTKQGQYNSNKKIYIPNNLTILATMNTSDQNVFPLDTAFKRRWDRERVVGDWNKCTFKDKFIPFTDITWEKFADDVNQQILNDEEGIISEDKQMGPFFATVDMFVDQAYCENNEDNKKALDKFINNVIDYLFNDVSKFNHEIIFDKDLKSFDALDKQINKNVKTYDQIKDQIFKNVLNIEFNKVDDSNE